MKFIDIFQYVDNENLMIVAYDVDKDDENWYCGCYDGKNSIDECYNNYDVVSIDASQEKDNLCLNIYLRKDKNE